REAGEAFEEQPRQRARAGADLDDRRARARPQRRDDLTRRVRVPQEVLPEALPGRDRPGFWILDFGFWIGLMLVHGYAGTGSFRSPAFQSKIQNPQSKIRKRLT